MSLAKGLSILFIFSKNQLLVLFIFIIVYFISFSFISVQIFMISFLLLLGFPGGLKGKASVHSVGDPVSIPGLGRYPQEGNANPLQYSCLENPMDGGAWCRLLSMGSQRVGRDFTFTFLLFSSPIFFNMVL